MKRVLPRYRQGLVFLLLAFFLSSLLGACASLPTKHSDEIVLPEKWQLHYAQVADIEQWEFQAQSKVSYQNKRWAFRSRWRCSTADGKRADFSLYTQQGQKLLQLQIFPDRATLKDRQGKVHQSDSGKHLLKQAIGIDIPVDYLCNWVAGIPYDGEQQAVIQTNPAGQLLRLNQASWEVYYLAYQQYRIRGETIALPTELMLSHGAIRIHLVVTQRIQPLLQKFDA